MQCCVNFCKNTTENVSTTTSDRITFHRFPNEVHLRAAWLKALGQQSSNLVEPAVVCSQHFLNDDLYETESGSRQIHAHAIPSTVQVCMICLNTDSKLFLLTKHKLDKAYEKLTGHPVFDLGNLKQTVCVKCAQRLMDYCQFRDMSLQVRSLMMELVQKHEFITTQHIEMIYRPNNKLTTMLGPLHLNVEHCDANKRTEFHTNAIKKEKKNSMIGEEHTENVEGSVKNEGSNTYDPLDDEEHTENIEVSNKNDDDNSSDNVFSQNDLEELVIVKNEASDAYDPLADIGDTENMEVRNKDVNISDNVFRQKELDLLVTVKHEVSDTCDNLVDEKHTENIEVGSEDVGMSNNASVIEENKEVKSTVCEVQLEMVNEGDSSEKYLSDDILLCVKKPLDDDLNKTPEQQYSRKKGVPKKNKATVRKLPPERYSCTSLQTRAAIVDLFKQNITINETARRLNLSKINEQNNKSTDKWQRKRELANERMRRYRDKQIEGGKAQYRKELAREHSRRYRERKRLNALKDADHLIHASQSPEQIEADKAQYRKELAREHSRRYRERKRLNALKVVDHLNYASQSPGQ